MAGKERKREMGNDMQQGSMVAPERVLRLMLCLNPLCHQDNMSSLQCFPPSKWPNISTAPAVDEQSCDIRRTKKYLEDIKINNDLYDTEEYIFVLLTMETP